MPFTPYHFGPSGFVGLLFRRWIDPVVFVGANVIVDVEVLFASGMFPHRNWHWHSFLYASIIGAIFGAAIYLVKPLRRLIDWFMRTIHLPYKANIFKMTSAGSLGACFHVLIDGLYHYDVQPMYPQKTNHLWRWLFVTHRGAVDQGDFKIICLLFIIPLVVLYLVCLHKAKKA